MLYLRMKSLIISEGGHFLDCWYLHFSMKSIKAAMFSSYWMFACKDMTSAVTKKQWLGGWRIFNKVQKMFCVFNVRWKIARKRLDGIGAVGTEMTS